uniref:Uncharacterized protein n=1 Tax=Streptomyces sp. NBC_01401 TaxID=2903854 RepID=A0AAU3H5I1_9ACTN
MGKWESESVVGGLSAQRVGDRIGRGRGRPSGQAPQVTGGSEQLVAIHAGVGVDEDVCQHGGHTGVGQHPGEPVGREGGAYVICFPVAAEVAAASSALILVTSRLVATMPEAGTPRERSTWWWSLPAADLPQHETQDELVTLLW